MKNNLTVVMLLSLMYVLTPTISLSLVSAQKETTDSEEPKLLAIQHTKSGTISKINSTTYSIELKNVSDKTILFSDRPDRSVTTVSTSDFIGNWTIGADSFAADAPNAVLVVDEIEQQDIAIVELFNPIYDIERKTIKYDATADNSTSVDLPNELGQTTLAIDEVINGCAWTGT